MQESDPDPASESDEQEAAKMWLADLLQETQELRPPGARPVVALDPDDSPAFLASLRDEGCGELHLVRRGQDHGHWLELNQPQPTSDTPAHKKRFQAARPILLPGHFDPRTLEGSAGIALYDILGEEQRFASWARDRVSHAEFQCALDHEPLFDPTRDRTKLTFKKPGAATTWAKASMLSDLPQETSMRLRVSAGREPRDEGNRDLPTHHTVAELGRALLPGMSRVAQDTELQEELASLLDGPALLTQPIAYWNTPGGGALFHHDAFDEDLNGGQRGVCFVQVTGRTAWLALSSEDLAHEVLSFLRDLLSGEWPHLEEALLPDPLVRGTMISLASDPVAVIDQLILPGCGQLAAIVNHAGTFTALLADAGHALVLNPGDVLLLPNQGLRHTLMHSVFYASGKTTYGLSLAMREGRPQRKLDTTIHRLGSGRRRRFSSRRRRG